MIVIKISHKLTIVFAIFILFIGSINFFFLYTSLYTQRVDEEIVNLLDRTHSHRVALENNFNNRTINQALSIEAYSKGLMFFADENLEITAISSVNNAVIKTIKEEVLNIDWDSSNWLIIDGHTEKYRITENFVVVGSPVIVKNNHVGFVFMLVETFDILKTADQIRNQFIWINTISALVIIVTIFVLSKLISIPLMQMSEATKKLSEGDFNVSLRYFKDDELGELSNSIQVLSDNLQQMHRERNEFLANIAHELKTPLTYIKGYADISMRDNITNTERDKYLLIIKEESDRLSKLIENLFELAQIEKHQLVIIKQHISLRKLAHQILDTMELSFNERNINLIFLMKEDIIVNVDPLRISQVFYNILDNARKYSLPNTDVVFNIEEIDDEVVIIVRNISEKISEKELSSIWDRFYRIEKSRSRSFGGSGIGLTIAKEIIELHGGIIDFTQQKQEVSVTIKLKKC